MTLPLIICELATTARPGSDFRLRDLTWTIREGETWAVVGPTGSGKTTLAAALAGRLPVSEGVIRWPLAERVGAADPGDVVQHLAFKEDSQLFSYGRHYYQQRFNFIEPDDDLSLDTYLAADGQTEAEIASVAERLGVNHLRRLSFLKLSNGQTRRARLAKALLRRPELLLLDDPFIGLDTAGRTEVNDLIGGLINDGLRVVLFARPGPLPTWVSNVKELGASRTTGSQLVATSWKSVPEQESQTAEVIRLRDVSVVYNGRPILDRVSWTVRAGERWAIVGPNGSGKSTLLSLLCGDQPQAYSNDVSLFDRRRGTGESIWELKARIGLVSPELHLYFTAPLTAAETAATGFFDVVSYRPINESQSLIVQSLFAEFGIADLADRPFARMSSGEQRLVLLVRALVKSPDLLILDEPFQALDESTVAMLREWLDTRLKPEQTMLFVSHFPVEIPASVTRWLRMEEGQVVSAD